MKNFLFSLVLFATLFVVIPAWWSLMLSTYFRMKEAHIERMHNRVRDMFRNPTHEEET